MKLINLNKITKKEVFELHSSLNFPPTDTEHVVFYNKWAQIFNKYTYLEMNKPYWERIWPGYEKTLFLEILNFAKENFPK
jgi:hypothetical protein